MGAVALAVLAIRADFSGAQDTAPPIMREFRAVWVATVDNMDWPSRAGLSTADQQHELIAILDKLVELHMNAIILQVRPAADALYASKIEPWSEYLTGKMGQAPAPYYDPLAFAITEAHKRGLELHAWINPYRARYSTHRPASPSHISRTNPELVRKYGPYVWMDPGDPLVRTHTERVVVDLVKRYDLDAIHMDDYFYPYKELKKGKEIDFPDKSTYRRYQKQGGRLGRDDWRRHNVDLLVKELYEKVHAAKPHVRFGISPFGIWRPGYPPSVRGLDQYSELYADARKWLNEGWVDYFTPQLYWAVDCPDQGYAALLQWWSEQNTHARHLWPGNYTGKIAFTNASAWRTSEILEQIRLTRAQVGASGNVHFSMKVFQQDPDSLDERLLREMYSEPALVPASPWLRTQALSTPVVSMGSNESSGDQVMKLRSAPASAGAPWLWVIQTRKGSAWTTSIVPGSEKLHVLGARGSSPPSDIRVMAVDRVGNLSPAWRTH